MKAVLAACLAFVAAASAVPGPCAEVMAYGLRARP